MSTHMPRFQSFFKVFLLHLVLVTLATISIRVKLHYTITILYHTISYQLPYLTLYFTTVNIKNTFSMNESNIFLDIDKF